MTDRQEDQLNMFDSVITFSDANTAATTSIAAYATTLTAFKAVVTNIKSKDQEVVQLIGGFSDTKADLKKKAADEGAKIAKAIFSYASAINDLTLKGQVKFAPSELQKKRDDALPQILNDIKAIANDLVTVTPPATNPLDPYGVTAARLTAFGTMITNYSNSISGPRDGVVNKKSNITQLNDLFVQANSMMKDQLDGLAFQVGGSFYTGYKNARIIVDSSTERSRFEGSIVDNAGKPIARVNIQAVSSEATYTGTSDDKGHYSINAPKFKLTYTLKFNKAGYAEMQIADQILKRGKATKNDIKMMPSA